jgi:hypothetical protein
MRDYQRKRGKYTLPHEVYLQTLWQIRDYDRLCKKYAETVTESPALSDGMPRAKGITSDPTYQKAVKLEHIGRVILAIETSLDIVPEEYRAGVWASVIHNKPYPINADRTTYGRWKSKFVYTVAEKLNFI